MFIFDNPTTESTSERVVKHSRTIPRAHDAPIHVCKFEPTSTLLASGSADGIVKVWDVRRGYATHAFRGHGGVVSALAFRYVNDFSSVVASEPTLHLITGSIDSPFEFLTFPPLRVVLVVAKLLRSSNDICQSLVDWTYRRMVNG